MRASVYQNNDVAGPGLVSEFLEQRGWCVDVVHADALTPRFAPEYADMHVFLGSPCNVDQVEIPWISRQREIMRELLRTEAPVFGICFGAQLIAAEAGGKVQPMGHSFEGWMRNAEVRHPEFEGPWLRWHEDEIKLPERADVLATDEGTVQVFKLGRAIGVQFHPEASGDVLRFWRTHAHFGGEPHASAIERAIAHADRDAAGLRERAFNLFATLFEMIMPYDASDRVIVPRPLASRD